jgi:hypothetical protein
MSTNPKTRLERLDVAAVARINLLLPNSVSKVQDARGSVNRFLTIVIFVYEERVLTFKKTSDVTGLR